MWETGWQHALVAYRDMTQSKAERAQIWKSHPFSPVESRSLSFAKASSPGSETGDHWDGEESCLSADRAGSEGKQETKMKTASLFSAGHPAWHLMLTKGN